MQRVVTKVTQRLEKMTYCARVRVCPSCATALQRDSPLLMPAELLKDQLVLINVATHTAGWCCCIAPDARGCIFTQCCSASWRHTFKSFSLLIYFKNKKRKACVCGGSGLFSMYEDFHREDIKRNIYGFLILWGKAPEKIHVCKLKPEKFHLEMKCSFNEENDRPTGFY